MLDAPFWISCVLITENVTNLKITNTAHMCAQPDTHRAHTYSRVLHVYITAMYVKIEVGMSDSLRKQNQQRQTFLYFYTLLPC